MSRSRFYLAISVGTSVWSFVQPPNCRNSCNFCRKSGNFCRKFSEFGEKNLRKVQKSGFSKRPGKGVEVLKFFRIYRIVKIRVYRIYRVYEVYNIYKVYRLSGLNYLQAPFYILKGRIQPWRPSVRSIGFSNVRLFRSVGSVSRCPRVRTSGHSKL